MIKQYLEAQERFFFLNFQEEKCFVKIVSTYIGMNSTWKLRNGSYLVKLYLEAQELFLLGGTVPERFLLNKPVLEAQKRFLLDGTVPEGLFTVPFECNSTWRPLNGSYWMEQYLRAPERFLLNVTVLEAQKRFLLDGTVPGCP